MSSRSNPKELFSKFKQKVRPTRSEEQNPEKREKPLRSSNQQNTKWKWAIEGMVSLMGYNVNLTSFWILPFYCMKYGALFLLPYIIVIVVCCFPLYYHQLALGQYSGQSTITVWNCVPLMTGIGYTSLAITYLISVYYATIMAWTLRYMLSAALGPALEWTSCSASSVCNLFPPFPVGLNCSKMCYNASYNYGIQTSQQEWRFPAEEFFHNGMLNITASIEEGGEINFNLFIWVLCVWAIVGLCLWRSNISASIFSFVSIVVIDGLCVALLIRLFMTDGAAVGLKAYFGPPSGKCVKSPEFWGEAGLLAFYTMFPNWGTIVTIGRFHRFGFKFNINAVLSCISSVIGNIVIGAIPAGLVGILAHNIGVEVSQLVTKGPSLIFVAVAQSFSFIPGSKHWAFIFYLLLFLISLNTLYWMINTIVISKLDILPKKFHRWYFRLLTMTGVLVCTLLISLATVCQAGLYVMLLFENYVGRWVLQLLALLEVFSIAFVYGLDRLLEDVYMMTHSKPWKLFWTIFLKILAPIVLILLIIYSFVQAVTGGFVPVYGDYRLPPWANIIGWVLNLAPLLCLSIFMLPSLATTPGATFGEVLKGSLKPNNKWVPANTVAGPSTQTGQQVEMIDRKIVEEKDPLKAKRPPKISGTEKAMKPGKINRATQVTKDVETQTVPSGSDDENKENDKSEEEQERELDEDVERGQSSREGTDDGRKKKHKHRRHSHHKRHNGRESSSTSRESRTRSRLEKQKSLEHFPPISDRRSRRKNDTEPTPIDDPETSVKFPPLSQQQSTSKRQNREEKPTKLPKIEENDKSSSEKSGSEKRKKKKKRKDSGDFYE